MSRHEIEIETVAEVSSVDRQSVSVRFYDDERLVGMMLHHPWRELQSITFPLAKAPAIIAALQAIVGAEGEV